MRIVEPTIKIEDQIDGDEILKKLERYGRVCYKSEDKIDSESAKNFIKNVISRGHESILEHEKVTVRVICDRGISHELVRHRIASYSQESTRYCNYSKDKFNNEITVIKPIWLKEGDDRKYNIWVNAISICERAYFMLLELGASPQEARSVLPNSLKTELIMTMNLRQWRHFLKLRTGKDCHPQMIEIAKMILAELKKRIPIIFDDIQ